MDNMLIVGYVQHNVLDEALKCFKETFLELLVRDITEWTSLSLGYADQEMYYLGLQEFVYMLSMVRIGEL